MSEDRVYLKGLNGIRAIAAIGVVVSHTLLAIHNFGFAKRNGLQFAEYGVTVFFTLSGFLITYLLLLEKEKINTIDIKKFYVRRILRIWPLYFLYVILACIFDKFVFIGGLANFKYIILYVLFLPNIAFNLNKYPNNMAHLWSIGVEEQFYAFWPFIVGRQKKLKKFVLYFVIIIILIRFLSKIISITIHTHLPYSIMASMRFDCMGIGAFFAIMYYYKTPLLLKISRFFIVELAFWLFVFLSIFYRFNFFSILSDDVVSIITGLFIIKQITSSNKFNILENPVMGFLGKISYGIYVYHALMISLIASVCLKYGFTLPSVSTVVFCVILLTIFVSYLSYTFIEKPFLKLKNKFSIIKSNKSLDDSNNTEEVYLDAAKEIQ